MFLVVEKIGAAAVDEDDELLLVFWRLGGGAVAARLVPGLFPVSLVAMARLRGFLSLFWGLRFLLASFCGMSSSSSSTAPPAKRQKNSGRRSYFLRSSVAPIFSTTRCINIVPVEVWREIICHKFLQLKDLSILRRCHSFFEKYWQNVMRQNVIRVPQGCATVQKAMDLAVIFSKRKDYTETEPLKIRLEEGVHEIVGNNKTMNVTCSHITFVGKGRDHTTIDGGFKVNNQQHVTFEELAVTKGAGNGLFLEGSETNVDVLKCVIKECNFIGMHVRDGATVTATQCEFMENGGNGVYCYGANTKARLTDCQMHHNGYHGLRAISDAVVDLHGTKTDIHSNKRFGICAIYRANVNIHLPSQHNTSHDNVGDDRQQRDGGSIANINADDWQAVDRWRLLSKKISKLKPSHMVQAVLVKSV
jgi:hypothetical protein